MIIIISCGENKEKENIMKREYINPDGLLKSETYTQLVKLEGGKTIFISGQIPFNEKGELIGKDNLEDQLNKVFENIEIALKGADANINDTIKTTYFIKDYNSAQLETIRKVIKEKFKGVNLPSSSLVGVQSLFHEDVLVEVEVIAYIK